MAGADQSAEWPLSAVGASNIGVSASSALALQTPSHSMLG